MKNISTPAEINSLFANGDPDEVWPKAVEIIGRINPAYDFRIARTAFDDIVRLFRGGYPGYCPVRTLYHDLRHTLDVFLCAVRLMHGVHLSGIRLTDDEITMIMMAALMHDIGYAQLEGEETGSGAQYLKTHVSRGIEFMQRYAADRHLPPGAATCLKSIILSTDPALAVSRIHFPDERIRLLGQIVGTADLTGQMADRTYLEKLLFLYLEFEEAHFGGFQNIHDLLRKTREFYEVTRQKLDGELGGIYTKLTYHFKDWFGVERNYYLESIEKNIAYLDKVTPLNEAKYLSMLKRGGIVEKTEALVTSGGIA
jgi:hypothetical protein